LKAESKAAQKKLDDFIKMSSEEKAAMLLEIEHLKNLKQ
jgi:hypothetical protein